MKPLIAFASLLLICTLAEAIDPPRQLVVVSGIGSDSCASYVLALADNRPSTAMTMDGKTYYTMANAYTQWINGFVTAINLSGRPGTNQIQVDVNGIAMWVRNWCEANPSESIVAGAGAFVRAHRPRGK